MVLAVDFSTHQSVSIHAFTFVEPKVDQLFAMHEMLRVSLEQALKHVGKVSHVELVVEVCCCFPEIVANLENGKVGQHGEVVHGVEQAHESQWSKSVMPYIRSRDTIPDSSVQI